MTDPKLEALLRRHEGVRLKPYRDTVGKLTIGVGRNLDDVGITPDEATVLLRTDIDRTAAGLDAALEGVALVPVAGILVGGAMSATVLAGRRGLDDLQARRGEVEAALSLGFEQRDAGLMVSRPAASEALVPGLDQTRTVGLVALPGAFVGTLLGGASPVQAGAVQLLVLVALLLVQALAVVLTVELLARGVLHR